MNYISFFIKFLYRIRYWLIFIPLIITLIAIYQIKHSTRNYTAYSTIYTGLVTGVNILSESGMTMTSTTQNSMMDNLLNIVTSDQTLKNVSLRLYARSMVYGDPNKDNIYIKASNYKAIYAHGTPIHHLIDKSSPNDSINEMNTYKNLLAYEKNEPGNYVYGIYRFFLPYFNRKALKTISVERDGNSDMLELSYTTDDPGIAYQTLKILNEEFIKQYEVLRFGETNNVIAYFERELARAARELKEAEDSLTIYSVKNKVINYGEETKQIAVLNKEYELGYWDSYRTNKSADHLTRELEKRIQLNAEIFRNNSDFLSAIDQMSGLNHNLTLPTPYTENPQLTLKDSLTSRLYQSKNQFDSIANRYGELQHSKEGISNDNVISEWLTQNIALEKSKSELEAMKKNKEDLDAKYSHYAPIGSTLTRKERAVSIAEQEYFSIMTALNNARLRQKSLQMTSATLKVMNEPIYPDYPLDSNGKKVAAGIFLASLIFVVFFFLLIELLDRTLRDSNKVKTVTGGVTAGAFTRSFRGRYRTFNQTYTDMSAKALCSFASTYFKPEKNNIVNIISNEPGEGKSFVLDNMAIQFQSMGMDVKKLSWHDQFETDAKAFVQSLELPDLDNTDKLSSRNTVILVEYPSLREAALTREIMNGVSLNLLVADSRRTWQTTDQSLYERLKDMTGATPLLFVLNYTRLETAEDFNGLMPPYTRLRKLFYRLSQLGLTAKDYRRKNA
ncbi:MAG: exopolysaccharide biosynthesis protein [Odoribacter splanchnicus]|nr:exopolysaccharide biosynthesis protein [Odoribacter splanchnicus]